MGHLRGVLKRLLAGAMGLAMGVSLLVVTAGPAQAAGDRLNVDAYEPWPTSTNVALGATVSASVTEAWADADYLVDGSTAFPDSNEIWGAPAAPGGSEVRLDFVTASLVSRIVLFPRTNWRYGAYFPDNFSLTLLDAGDNPVWTKSYTGQANPVKPVVADLEAPVTAKSLVITMPDSQLAQIAEVAVFNKVENGAVVDSYAPNALSRNVAQGAFASSSCNGGVAPAEVSDPATLVNGVTSWYDWDKSISHPDAWWCDPWGEGEFEPADVSVVLPVETMVKRLVFFPRGEWRGHYGAYFPREYTLRLLDAEGVEVWSQSYTGMQQPAGPVKVDFDSPVAAQTFEMNVTRRYGWNTTDFSQTAVSLSEIAIFDVGVDSGFENEAVVSSWAPRPGLVNIALNAPVTVGVTTTSTYTDGVTGFPNTENGMYVAGSAAGEYDPVVVRVELPVGSQAERIVVFPRVDVSRSTYGIGFPREFTVSLLDAEGNTTWSEAYNFVGRVGAPLTIDLPGAPVEAASLVIDVTRRNESTFAAWANNLFQLSEIAVFGSSSNSRLEMGRVTPLLLKTGEQWTLPYKVNIKPVPVVEWSSSDEGVATVSDGVITAVAPGVVTITMASGADESTLSVTVRNEIKKITDNVIFAAFWAPPAAHVNDANYQILAEGGIDLVQNVQTGDLTARETNLEMARLADKYGMQISVADGRFAGPALLSLTADEIKALAAEYVRVPGVGSFYLMDEPKGGIAGAVAYARAFNALKEIAPDYYMHLNFYNYDYYGGVEGFKTSMRLWADAIDGQDYLMYDEYPFLTGDRFTGEHFYNGANAVRELGLEKDMLTGSYAQARASGSIRYLTPSELRFQVNTFVAYGMTQVSYWNWWGWGPGAGQEAVVTDSGAPTPNYYALQQVHKEIHAIGPVLMRVDATEVYLSGTNTYNQPVLPSSFVVQPDGVQPLQFSKMVDKETGEEYVMVVNRDFKGPQTVSLTFGDEVGKVEEVSRVTGDLEPVALTGHTLSGLTLAAGDAVMYKLSAPVKTGLETVIALAEALDSDAYTTSSWATESPAVVSALAAAQLVASDPTVMQDAIDAAADVLSTALNDALAALVLRGDPTVLQTLVDVADALSGTFGAFTEDSVLVLTAAVDAAKADLAVADDRSQDQLTAGESAIQAALSGLTVKAPAVSKAVLQQVYDGAKVLSNTDGTYTSDSWTALQGKITAAKTVLDDGSATQPEVDVAVGELTSALLGLVVAPSKAVLEQTYDTAKALSNTDGTYTSDSWTALQDKITAAKAVLDDGSATQAKIDTAVTELNTAVAGLVVVPVSSVVDDSGLRAAIELADSLSGSDYTAGSWSGLQAVLVSARSVLGDRNASQEEVDDAEGLVSSAVAGLVFVSVSLSQPVLSGTAKVGGVLSVAATVLPSDAVVKYEWFRGTQFISQATGASYTVQSADAGQGIKVKVTVTRDGSSSVVKYSNTLVIADQIKVTKKALPATGTVGDMVSLDLAYTPVDAAVSVQWFRGTALIAGASGTQYVLTAADSGSTVVAKVTVSKDGFDPVTVYSSSTVVSGPVAPAVKVASLSPAGTVPVGQALNLNLTVVPEGASVKVEWFTGSSLFRVGGVPVTGMSYTPTAADVGKDLVVKVTVTVDGFASVVKYTNRVVVTPAA